MPLSDGTNSLLKAGVNNDMEMINVLLSANLESNFIDSSGFMYKLASKYQSREKGVKKSLALELFLFPPPLIGCSMFCAVLFFRCQLDPAGVAGAHPRHRGRATC